MVRFGKQIFGSEQFRCGSRGPRSSHMARDRNGRCEEETPCPFEALAGRSRRSSPVPPAPCTCIRRDCIPSLLSFTGNGGAVGRVQRPTASGGSPLLEGRRVGLGYCAFKCGAPAKWLLCGRSRGAFAMPAVENRGIERDEGLIELTGHRRSPARSYRPVSMTVGRKPRYQAFCRFPPREYRIVPTVAEPWPAFGPAPIVLAHRSIRDPLCATLV